MGGIGIRVFEIPNRRGRFALTADVAEWLLELRGSDEIVATAVPEIPTTERRKP